MSNLRAVLQWVEMIATNKTAPTAVVSFEQVSAALGLPPLSDNVRLACHHRGITAKAAPCGFWPIPEAFRWAGPDV